MMSTYRSPLADMSFVLNDVLDAPNHYRELGREDVSRDTLESILREAATFSEEVISPLNGFGDEIGARRSGEHVITPPGFADAYRRFCEAGWPALAAPTSVGGHGLPASVEFPVAEMLSSANLAWRTYSGLSTGAVALLLAHADEALQRRYAPKLASGEWLPTMCLTEPQCGTDLSLIRTRAEPAEDGAYRIFGEKIFITGGDHDLTGDIVHLVLARLPDAPAGSRGISLFLAPKHLDEQPGARNAMTCTAVEHKLGIRGSATCAMSFAGAKAWLIGAPHGGLACMFTMMNHARLAVGVQGLGLAELAAQRSLAYARERRQGRAVGAAHTAPAAPLVAHADVRRMLLTQRALAEGSRTLAYFTAQQMDRAEHHPRSPVRREAQALLALLTPITKAFITEAAVENANLAIQIHGGHGYIKETGVEQLLRDARVLPIYEGANGVQALDLLSRKVLADDGRALFGLLDAIERWAYGAAGSNAAPLLQQLGAVTSEWRALSTALLDRCGRAPLEIGAAATDFLRYSGYALLAWCWARQAHAVSVRRPHLPDAFRASKMNTARFFFARILPRALAHAAAASAGAATLEMGEE